MAGHFLRRCGCGERVRLAGINALAKCPSCGNTVGLKRESNEVGSNIDQDQTRPITISPVGED